MEMFDLVVMGGGPGGYMCAERAAQRGQTVALCESKALGGTCLNEGCIPTKSLLYCGKQYASALHGNNYGVSCENVRYDHAYAIDRKNAIVKMLVSGIAATMEQHNVKIYPASAKIIGKTADKFQVSVGNTVLSCKHLVIATGSVAVVPPIPGIKQGLESGFVMTNHEILDCKEAPETLVCIGGGVIGLEMACYYSTIGKQVHVIEMMPKIAGTTDADLCDILMKTYKRQGMSFCLSSKVESIAADGVTYVDESGTHTVHCARVLLAVGRRPNIDGIGLDSIGINVKRGAIETDEHLRTNVPHVYAVGDCNGKLMLAHTAYREAEVAVNNILGLDDIIDYNSIPSVIYTTPEVAFVGETEESATVKGISIKAVKVPMMMSGRYVAENKRGDGFCKLIYDKVNNRLIGAQLIGSYASEMIFGAAMMIQDKIPLEQLKKAVYPHPTVSEVIREALFML